MNTYPPLIFDTARHARHEREPFCTPSCFPVGVLITRRDAGGAREKTPDSGQKKLELPPEPKSMDRSLRRRL